MSITRGLSHSKHFVTVKTLGLKLRLELETESLNTLTTDTRPHFLIHQLPTCKGVSYKLHTTLNQSCHTQVYLSHLWRLKSDNTAKSKPHHCTHCLWQHAVLHTAWYTSIATLCLWQHAVIRTAWYTSTATLWHTASVLVTICSHPHWLIYNLQTRIATHAVIHTAWHTSTDTHCLLVSNATTYSHPHYLIYASIAMHSLPQPWRSTPCLQQIMSNVKWILLKNSTQLREVKRNLNNDHGGFKLGERWQTVCLLILPQQ